MRILGLDMSSTCIGSAALSGDDRPALERCDLKGDIAVRCAQAAAHVAALLDRHQPALVVIESPVARFAKAIIPQTRVSGAVLAELSRRRALWVEVAPSRAKQVLCGDGAATKREMVDTVARRFGHPGPANHFRGKWGLWLDGKLVLSEDEADAYALALCGQAMRVVTKGAA